MIELYGKKWTDPVFLYTTKAVAANGDDTVTFLLRGRNILLWSIKGVNLTRNGLKQSVTVFLDSDMISSGSTRMQIDEQQIQTDDCGTAWLFIPPLIICQGYAVGVYLQDCIANDVLEGNFMISFEVV